MANFEVTRQSLYADIHCLHEQSTVKNDLRNMCDLYVGLLNLHDAVYHLEFGQQRLLYS